MRKILIAWMTVAAAALGAGVVAALTPLPFGPAIVTKTAERAIDLPDDIVAVYGIGEVTSNQRSAIDEAARSAGGVAVPARTGALGLAMVERDGNVIHAVPDGYLEPLIFSAIPQGAIGWVLGTEVAVGVGPNTVVLNEGTAELAGDAKVGDVIELVTNASTHHKVTVGAIASEELLGGAEVVMTSDLASNMGTTENNRTLIYGIDSRQAFDDAAAAAGLEDLDETRVLRSWDPFDPDSTLSTLETKQKLGVPWYRPTNNGVSMHPRWQAANLMSQPELLNSQIPVRARCHIKIKADLQAAFTDVAAAGLSGAIDVDNTNTYGGCYVPRYSRHSNVLSRHAYGMAIDVNTLSNCQGCVPKLNCEVVRIFREHGFAWGGNFRRPDGMHFEWVGEPRHDIYYESNYCPNDVPKPPPTTTTTTTTSTSTSTTPSTTSTTSTSTTTVPATTRTMTSSATSTTAATSTLPAPTTTTSITTAPAATSKGSVDDQPSHSPQQETVGADVLVYQSLHD